MNSISEPTTEEISNQRNPSGLVPLGHAVLIRPFEPEIAAGKIIIPDSVKEGHKMREIRGVVMAIGPEAWVNEKRPRAKKGDTVLVSQYCGVILQSPVDKQWYRMVNGDDVYCGVDESIAANLPAQNPKPHDPQRSAASRKLHEESTV